MERLTYQDLIHTPRYQWRMGAFFRNKNPLTQGLANRSTRNQDLTERKKDKDHLTCRENTSNDTNGDIINPNIRGKIAGDKTQSSDRGSDHCHLSTTISVREDRRNGS